MAINTNTLEGGSAGTTITSGNSGGTSGTAFASITSPGSGSLTYETTAAFKGGFGGRAAGGATSDKCMVALQPTTGTGASAFRFYFRLATLPTAAITVARVTNGAATSNYFSMLFGNLGKIIISDNAGTALPGWAGGVTQSPASLSAATWYRAEFSLDNSGGATAGACVFKIFVGDNLSALTSFTYAAGNHGAAGAAFASLNVGRAGNSTETSIVWFDDLYVNTASTALPGPSGSGSAAPTANPGPDVTSGVSAGSPVSITGSGTADTGLSIVGYQWAVVSVSAGAATPSLTGATTATVTFTPSAQAVYTLSLTVTDSLGVSSGASNVIVYCPGASVIPHFVVSNPGLWTNVGGATSFVEALFDSSDVTYLQSNATAASPSKIRVRLNPLTTPTAFELDVSCQVSAAGGGSSFVRLFEGATQRKQWTITPTTGITTPALTLSSGEIATVTDWHALDVEFEQN